MTTLREPDAKDELMEEKISQIIRERGKGSQVFNVVRGEYVNLLGYVDGYDTKKEIDSLVQKIPGVRIVTNHIRIKPWERTGSVGHF